MRSSLQAFDGCYEAARAAALSGVPVSTVYEWARGGVLVPSISSTREKLWSYRDLMALRIVYWLRHPKDGTAVPASTMTEVRNALEQLDSLKIDIWSANEELGSPLRVDAHGRIFIESDSMTRADGQQSDAILLDLLGPFDLGPMHGPDLRRPRPHLRIVPGKCSGEPHVVGTRLTTLAVKALADRGFDEAAIRRLYPAENADGLREAIDLERQLAA